MNDNATASRPNPLSFDRKPISGAHERRATIVLGISRSIFLEPVVRGIWVSFTDRLNSARFAPDTAIFWTFDSI